MTTEKDTRKTIALMDTNFVGQPGTSPFVAPQLVQWKRDAADQARDVVVMTDRHLRQPARAARKIGWLLESPAIKPRIYDRDDDRYARFESVWTFKKTMLDRGDKFKFLPFGSTHLRPEEIDAMRDVGKIGCAKPEPHTCKSKLVSMIASTKDETSGHKLRCAVADELRGRVDLFGKGRERRIKMKGEKLYAATWRKGIQVVDINTIVKGIRPEALTPPGVTSSNNNV